MKRIEYRPRITRPNGTSYSKTIGTSRAADRAREGFLASVNTPRCAECNEPLDEGNYCPKHGGVARSLVEGHNG